MQPVTIHIKPDGSMRFLVSEDAAPFLTATTVVRRASHVEPHNSVLRVVFHWLRKMFGEYGLVADLTRRIPCLWRVNLSPTSGPILPELYKNRQAAIDAEIGYLNENFI